MKKINRLVLTQFGNLELLAKQVVEGFITGLHKSPFHGFSVEFAEHRIYNKGESTRHIDWKLFARSGKLFTKKYEEETNLRCQLVIDASSSMFFPRGYLYTAFNRLSTMGVDYRFPIKNTDINIGRVIYITRLKGNVFADWGMGEDNLSPTRQSFQSFGVDLSAQFHALRFSEGFELGVRAMYLSASKSWAFVPLVIDIGF